MVTSLYIHSPFCSKKCPYCNFFVLPDKNALKLDYLEALLLEWEQKLPHIKKTPLCSIYFGGGTPTLFPKGITTILEKARKQLSLKPSCEITVEGNPETLSLPLLKELKECGVNRLSLGAQSFDNTLLNILGRTHKNRAIFEAIDLALAAGIKNISIDLMYEIPHQSLSRFKNTLLTLKSLPISHLSLYNLQIEENTPFFRKKKVLTPHLPTEEEGLQMLNMACTILEEMGLKRYEISAFAKKGKESRHNLGYWTGRPFLGLGPSAFSFYEGKRFRNVANLTAYKKALKVGKAPIDFDEKLPYPNNVHEQIAIGLRVFDGICLKTFEKEVASLPKLLKETLQALETEGLIHNTSQKISLSEKGRLFYDTVAESIVL